MAHLQAGMDAACKTMPEAPTRVVNYQEKLCENSSESAQYFRMQAVAASAGEI